MNVDRNLGMRPVENSGPAINARPNAVVVLPGHDHFGAEPDQISPQVTCDIEIEPCLGITTGGFSAGRVAVFPFPAVPDLFGQERRVGIVQAIVPGIYADYLARQWPALDRRTRACATRRSYGYQNHAEGEPAGGERDKNRPVAAKLISRHVAPSLAWRAAACCIKSARDLVIDRNSPR